MESTPKPIPKLGLYLYTNAVDDIVEANGLDETFKSKLVLDMARAIRTGKLQVRDSVTGGPFPVTPSMEEPSCYVILQDVNKWLGENGYPYQWTTNTVKVINQSASLPVQKHQPKMRRDLLTGPIEQAIKAAGNYECADVYIELKDLALAGISPFSGDVSDGALSYTNAKNGVAALKKTALGQRLKRLKKH